MAEHSPLEATSETGNLSNRDLFDRGWPPEDLRRLDALRQRLEPIGARVLVRYVMGDLPGEAGFVYGITISRDFPFWRGTFEDIELKADSLLRERVP